MKSAAAAKKAPVKAGAKRRTTILSESIQDKLSALDIPQEQIDALVKLVPGIRYALLGRSRRPTIERQREALDDMASALKLTEKAFMRAWKLSDPKDEKGLGMVLRRRLDAACGHEFVRGNIDGLLDAVAGLSLAVGRAIHGLPKKGIQVRDQVPTMHIRVIHEAVPDVKPSKNETSKFVKIVRLLCAEAGFPDENPERAIRKYQTDIRDSSNIEI